MLHLGRAACVVTSGARNLHAVAGLYALTPVADRTAVLVQAIGDWNGLSYL